MRELLRVFGWAAAVSGLAMFTYTLVAARITPISGLTAVAWLLGGSFWLACCGTIANIEEHLEAISSRR